MNGTEHGTAAGVPGPVVPPDRRAECQMSGTYTDREGLTKDVTDYDPRDDYTDSELAAMDEDGPWPRCTSCGWSPDWTPKPHSVFVEENTTSAPHQVQVDPADLNSY